MSALNPSDQGKRAVALAPRRLLRDGQPLLQIWIGHFFEPFYSDRALITRSLVHARELGFNTVNLDAKPWEDFFERYRGGPASPYVEMLEFMLAEIAAAGLKHDFLALYLCGDNLFPTIRDVPPVRGEDAVGVNGQSLQTYKYWSEKAQATMLEHVAGLRRLYRDGGAEFAGDGPRYPIQSMFEPVPKPSFDDEGRTRYLAWLGVRYANREPELRARYGVGHDGLGVLTPADYWFEPEKVGWVWCAAPASEDFQRRTPMLWRWLDNQTYLKDESVAFMAAMKRKLRALDPSLYLEPVLHQWGFLFNPPGFEWWETGRRALDPFLIAPHVDSAMFIAAPLNAELQADAGVLSVEYAVARSLNFGREFTAGLYLGRHCALDVYRHVSPAEAIATAVAAGAAGLHVYGYSGLDDGGVMGMMDEPFLDSVKIGNRWAARVIPRLTEPRTCEIAMLFPAAMSLYEPLTADPGGRHRMDFLGWHQQLIDLGYHVDVLHPEQIKAGRLADFRALVAPFDSCYDFSPDAALERAIAEWVGAGGALVHGPGDTMSLRLFGLIERAVAPDCIRWQPRVIPHGWSTVEFEGCETLAIYEREGGIAIGRKTWGQGAVYSFGFEYGYAYSRRTMPPVPQGYGRLEAHPVVLLPRTPVQEILELHVKPQAPGVKGLEIARFGRHVVCVNHRAVPVSLAPLAFSSADWQVPSCDGKLAAHSAVLLELRRD